MSEEPGSAPVASFGPACDPQLLKGVATNQQLAARHLQVGCPFNELEYFNGEIYANVWHRDVIAIINPDSGKVTGWIDLKGLIADSEVRDPEAVLNGIAYDAAGQRLFVTGKLWPKLFEIRIKK